MHVHTHIERQTSYKNQLETHGLSFIGRLPSSTISFPNKKVFFMYNCGEKPNWSLHLTLGAQDSHLGSLGKPILMVPEQAHLD